ncbi:hypothetical protein C8R41DRAFT_918911 [Lentinula lateritia]|uniref:Uncharacterized protein n=1 Tax=Lentinula lateritia TaxID=40482 RepID=A0ABQ8VIK8_9AGAR|nr:hypothetical protein C8R41DRAFT_918911 [Lentinula lateritia]
MSVRFSLAKATSFRPWSKKTSTESDIFTGHHMHADTRPASITRLHSSPERLRADSSGSGYLDRVPENGSVEFDGRDEEENINEIDEEFESQGLYRGSYRRLLVLYAFVPLSFVAFFVLLALLPIWVYPLQITPEYPSVLPFPFPELFVSAGLWCLSYLLRTPIYSLSVLICTSCWLSHEGFPTVLSTVAHAILSLFFRLLAIPILVIPHYLVYDNPTWRDPAFRRVWWVSLGWAAVEGIVAIKQGYANIALYRDVLVHDVHEDERIIEIEDRATKLGRIYGATDQITYTAEPSLAPLGVGSSERTSPTQSVPLRGLATTAISDADASSNSERVPLLLQRESRASNIDLETSLELQVEDDIDQLMAVRARDELGKYYGIPFIRIPAFISCLQRANALLFSLGVTLILSSAYLRSTISSMSWYSMNTGPDVLSSDKYLALYVITSDSPSIPSLETFISSAWPWSTIQLLPATFKKSNHVLTIGVPVVTILQIVLSLLHSHLVLPKAGVHTVVYIGSLVSLGVFFIGLSVWDALS